MRFRWSIIALSLIVSVYALIHPNDSNPGFSFSNIKENIQLGLDLKGGIFMQLEVDVEDAVVQYLEEQAGTIKAGLEGDEFKVSSSKADFKKNSDGEVTEGRVILNNVTSTKYDDIRAELKKRYENYWYVEQNGSDITFRLKETAKADVQNDAVSQTVYKIQNRIDELGVTEPVINRTIGSNRIVMELAGADDEERVNNIVKEPGKLEWRLVQPNSRYDAQSPQELLAATGGKPLPGTKVFPYPNPETGATSYMLLQEVLLTARNVANVFATSDDRGLPAVGVTLDRSGGQIFNTKTGQNVGNLLAIVLDGKIISAPRIQSQLSERFIITGQFSIQEVQDMVVKIKSGSLPAEVRILESRKIGPTLGRDAIAQGTSAGIMGLVIVVLFILAYYRLAGVFAFLALGMNLIIIMGMLAGMGAVLTLPGIAGFILTIGMAVDANVLVFERIREELRAGTMPRSAVEIGYKTAFVTIMDANITTFLAAFCLLMMGEGPVRGFAIMLMIGIVSSIFTAVFCSRTFFLASMGTHSTAKTLSIWPIWGGQPKAN